MWINRDKLNNSLAVFIHSLRGQPVEDLEKGVTVVQEACRHAPRLRSFDMYLFRCRYDTDRQPFRVEKVLDELRDLIVMASTPYRTAVLVGFREGGVLAKLFVLRQLQQARGKSLIVDRIVTVATAHRGIPLFDLLLWLGLIPWVGAWLSSPSLTLTASRGAALRELLAGWCDPWLSATPCPPTGMRRYICSTAVVTRSRRLVNVRSEAGFKPIDQIRYASSASPGTPGRSLADRLAIVIQDELHKHDADSINAIETRIKGLLANKAALDDYVRTYASRVANVALRGIPWLSGDPERLNTKIASLLMNFLDDYPRRPLRGLEFGEAVEAYARRQVYHGSDV
jgi:hypothetical protein